MPRSTLTPGVSRGTRIIDCWRCRSASGSVLPITMKISAAGLIAPVIHHLRPLTTYSSPSRRIVVEMFVASEEATSGSVIAKADRISPASSGVSQRSFCSSLPNSESTSMLPVSGAAQLNAAGARWPLRPVISASGAYCRFVRPAPRSPGRKAFHSSVCLPRSRSLRITGAEVQSHGSSSSPSCWWKRSSCGYTWWSMNSSSCWRSSSVRAS